MNEIKIFSKKEYGSIRTVEVGGKIYFVASDVAKSLGYARPNDAVSAHCRYTAKYSIPHPQSKGKYMEVNVIPQGDVVRLAVKSELPSAEKFESWIFDEVIPSVLNYGSYSANEKSAIEQEISVVKFIADDLNVNTASRILMYENYCKDVGIPTGFLPKYEHNGSREMKALSTLLRENDCGISAVKFNQRLIEAGYLEERERLSSSGNTKKYKALTDNGLQYGENAVNPHNQKEVQPLYYTDTFLNLYNIVA